MSDPTTVLVPGTGVAAVVVDEVETSDGTIVNAEIVKLGTGDTGEAPTPVTEGNPFPTRDVGLADVLAQLLKLTELMTAVVDGDVQVRLRAGEVEGATVLAVPPAPEVNEQLIGGINHHVQVRAQAGCTVGFVILAGFTGTLTPECSLDDGKNWVATTFGNPATGARAATLAPAGALTSRSVTTVEGATHYRVRVTTYTSGKSRAVLRTAPGMVAPMIGVTDGTTSQIALCDSSSRLVNVGAGASTGSLTGNPVAVAGAIVDGASYSTHRGHMVGTKGADGLYHHLVSDALAQLKVIVGINAYSVHSSSVVTSSSNSGVIASYSWRCVSLYYSVSSATPSGGTMTYTVEEIAPNTTTVIKSTSRSFSATGSGVIHLGSVNSAYVRVSWVLTGGSPSYTVTSAIYSSASSGGMNEGNPGDAIPVQAALLGGTDGGTLRALAVAPGGGVRIAEGGIATYTACFTDSTGTALSGGAAIMTLWHDSSNATPIHIRRITLTTGYGTVPAGCGVQWTVRRITAENGTPGGTGITPCPVDAADSASTLVSGTGRVRTLPADPTAASGSSIVEWMSGVFEDQFEWTSSPHGKPIELRAGQSEGIEIRYDNVGTQSVGITYSVAVEWTEGTAVT